MVGIKDQGIEFNPVIENDELKFDTYYDPGTYYMSVTYVQDGYYSFATNETNFNVSKINTTIDAVATNITSDKSN